MTLVIYPFLLIYANWKAFRNPLVFFSYLPLFIMKLLSYKKEIKANGYIIKEDMYSKEEETFLQLSSTEYQFPKKTFFFM